VASATFIGGALLDAEKGAWWQGSAGGYVGWLLARLDIDDDRLLLAPTVLRLFGPRTAPKSDVRSVARTFVGVRIEADGVLGRGFVFWPLPGQRRAVIDALVAAGYPLVT